MRNLVKISLFGDLADKLGKRVWNLDVKSVSEALYAINILTRYKFQQILENDESNYSISVNGEYIESLDEIALVQENKLVSIEIMPSVEGCVWVFIGKLLIVAIVSAAISYGIAALMKTDPGEKADSNPSYLMDGTTNLAKQGLPVPLGYGRMIVGSLVVGEAIRYQDI